jgi:hypothetical protein
VRIIVRPQVSRLYQPAPVIRPKRRNN